MKKILSSILLLCFVACSKNNDPEYPQPTDAELFVRDDAARTTIPLVVHTSWNYRKNIGTEEKPDKLIRNLLLNDRIIDMKILPVRQYDNNSGNGKYEYKALCYITENQTVYFYMNDRIFVGRYLYPDNYGYESVIWDFELPTYYTENSTRYFTLNRAVSFDNPNVNKDENFLREVPGFHTIDVEITAIDVKRYKDCKLFQYNNQRTNPNESVRTNYFYFKDGIGLVKYQQEIKVGDTTALLYEQVLIEP